MARTRSRTSGREISFPSIDFLFSLRPTKMRLGLENITALLRAHGDPQCGVPSVLVAGTNGKGSVATFVSSILRAAGLKTGTFYSPHLFRINERIRIDGDEIPGLELDRIIGQLRKGYDETPFTFFEGVTAAAAIWFREQKVDAAVYEVGLGGRLDATRLVDARVTAITGIAIDHSEHLGRTRAKILDEKLGITRPGAPLVANLATAGLEKRAAAHCMRMGIPFYPVSKEAETSGGKSSSGGMTFSLSTPLRDYGDLKSGMIGLHQVRNAATAVRAAEIFLPGRRPGKAVVRKGLARASFAGRFQVLNGEPRVILDVSHNEEALCASLDTLLSLSPPERNVIVFGVMARKQLGRFPERAIRSAREIILVPLKEKGAAGREELAARFQAGDASSVSGAVIRTVGGMAGAIKLAEKLTGPHDTMLILGSHLAVEEAVAHM
jgi:dihydrofolate synthase/folylpolyglutamate synthase